MPIPGELPPPRSYIPPLLLFRIRLRNPVQRPAPTQVDAFGRSTGPEPVWGIVVWAARRDLPPIDIVDEGVATLLQRTIWTVRHRKDIDPDVEVVFDGEVWQSDGPPVSRGGPGSGHQQRYLDIYCERRT